MTSIVKLMTEYRRNPLGIDVVRPRLSWQLSANRQGVRQSAYRVIAASQPHLIDEGQPNLWDSGRIDSDQSVHVTYDGQPLQSRERVYWQVVIWDETDEAHRSETVWFEMGLLDTDDWKAQWIGTPFAGGPRSTFPVPHLRKAFSLEDDIASARLYITALGVFECSINGQPVGEDVFAPGWTDYRQRVQYLTYDVTPLLHRGDNVIGALLGDGWAVGHVGWLNRQNYADQPQLLAQLEITLNNGSTHRVISDGSWIYLFGPITHSDFMTGEAYDARQEMPGWNTPQVNPPQAMPVTTFQHPTIRLVALNGPTVRRINELIAVHEPVNRGSMGRKRYVFDLGQNMVGWARFKGSAPAGTTIMLRFAEVLNPDGSLYTANLRSAHATDYYTFKGDGEETWEPKFTFHGFRYVEIEGYAGPVARDTITGIVIHSDIEQTGSFECSDAHINQLQSNILWGQKGNFVDVPTDCPQRDERLGWTGDIQVFVSTAAFNMNVAAFMAKWAQDVSDAQNSDGSVPAVVPYAADVPTDGGPAWADAAIICPWTIYQSYGDVRILEQNYETMTRFMDFLIEASPGYIRCAPDFEGWPGFGDWLSINANTPRDLIGTAFLAYDAKLMAQIASVLGRSDDAIRYQQLFEDTKAAFTERFLVGGSTSASQIPPSEIRRQMDDADRLSRGNLQMIDYGNITSEVFNVDVFSPTQTAYVLALHFDLFPEELRPLAVSELVADLERRGMHLSTGFVGSPYLNHVLSHNGRLDIAYALLNQKSWPSWLYAVTQGATTIWERWDGWTQENGFQTPEMNSFNHYAYGAIGDWLYKVIAGINIDPNAPGYKHALLSPKPGGDLTFARAALDTLYGKLVSDWKLENGIFDYTVTVPPNTNATVYLPQKGRITLNGDATEGLVYKVTAGTYKFVVASV